uniref:Uncharacterized protein n=1 Tax=Cannabis sativa TaxID=3483 RepID=A0A803PPT5_CANSA
MPRMKRSRRILDEYDPHVTQFIRAKLIVPKSKNLDKARGGKVMITELLKIIIASDDPRNQAFKLRPLVFSTISEHQVQLIKDDYLFPETVVTKP